MIKVEESESNSDSNFSSDSGSDSDSDAKFDDSLRRMLRSWNDGLKSCLK